jgi:hypothetical protein
MNMMIMDMKTIMKIVMVIYQIIDKIMNKKYERYINFIADDIQAPYFINMKQMYGLRPDEYELVLNKVYNQPVTTNGRWEKFVYDSNDNEIYWEDSNSNWVKQEYDDQGKIIYWEDNTGFWYKYEYDDYGYENYYENSDGEIEDNRYE